MSKWILSACAALLVAACGQKGPLYLPDENGTVVTRPGQQRPAPSPKPDAEEEEGNDRPQQRRP